MSPPCEQQRKTPCELAPPTSFADRVCAAYPSCSLSQFISNPGSCDASERCASCSPSCDPDAGCTGPSSAECNECLHAEYEGECVDSCPEGFQISLKTKKCVTCTGGPDCECGDGYFSSNDKCVKCKSCKANQFMVEPCGDFANTKCQTISKCWVNEYEESPPSKTSDRVCNRVTKCVVGEEYEALPRTKTSDRVCMPYSDPCDANDEIQVQNPTKYQDRVCAPKPTCDYRTEYLNKNTCASLTECDESTHFESRAPTQTSNRLCKRITKCKASEEEAVAPTPTSDRVCRKMSIKFWKATSYSPLCPKECGQNDDGSFTQKRTVECVDKSTGEVVPDDQCNEGKKPALERSCPRTECFSYEYQYGAFSSCDKRCGGGVQQRTSKCIRIGSLGSKKTVAKSLCADLPHEPEERSCNAKLCHWKVSTFGACSESCGGGVQLRDVSCYNPNTNKKTFASECLDDAKPAAEKACNTFECEEDIDDDGDSTEEEKCSCLQTWLEKEKAGRSFYQLVTDSLPKNGRAVLNASSVSGFCEYKWQLHEFCDETFTENELLEVTDAISRLRVRCDAPMWITEGDETCDELACGTTSSVPVSVRCVKEGANQKPVTISDDECALLQKPQDQKMCFGPPCVSYEWKALQDEWSECSSPCGGGIQTKTYKCFADGREIVDDSKCDAAQKPQDEKSCNENVSCKRFEWFAFPWSTCDANCAQTREITCMRSQMRDGMLRLDASYEQVDDSYCVSFERPETSKTCSAAACGTSGKLRYSYHAGEKVGCTSSSCGVRLWTREVTCRTAAQKIVSELFCAGLKRPITKGICGVDDEVSENLGDLDDIDDDLIDIATQKGTYVYQTSEWKECSADCDSGQTYREVTCVNKTSVAPLSLKQGAFQVVDDRHCLASQGEPPADVKACNTTRALATRGTHRKHGARALKCVAAA